MTSTIDAAETTLPELLGTLHAGDTVIITSGESKTPVAKLEALAVSTSKPQRLGVCYNPDFKLGDAFWEPLPEEELRLWNGEGE